MPSCSYSWVCLLVRWRIIQNEAGAIMWAGVLQPRRLHWLDRRPTQPWNYQWHPLTVPAETWTAWFEAKPSYRAILRTNESL